jgi:hypothetical protein
MAYYPPQLLIYQEFQPTLLTGITPLYAFLMGPSYALHRYAVEAEKARVGDYDRDVMGQLYDWPNHVAGGVVDLERALVQVENALLRYYRSFDSLHAVADNSNQFRSGVIFSTNAYSGHTEIAFGTRGVQAGDTARLRWIDPGDMTQRDFETVVAAFVADVVPGTTAPVPRFATHFGSTTLAATEDPAHPRPTRLGATYDAAAYAGLAAGFPSDTYSITVTAVGYGVTSGGTLDGTTLRITSAGGDESTAVLGEAGAPWMGAYYAVPIGARGAVMQITDAGSGTLMVGQLWLVAIAQNYTEVDIDNAAQFDVLGTYLGTKSTQYIVSVLRGGRVGTDSLVFTVRTNNGADSEGQIQVPAADFSLVSANDYPCGALDMVLHLVKNTDWCTGDTFVFDVTAQGAGAMHTIVFQDAVPVETGVAIDLDLFITESKPFDAAYIELTADQIGVEADAFITTDTMGASKPLAVFGGVMFADYRELRTATANVLGVTNGLDSVETLLGPAVQENPLALGVYMARLWSGSVEVYYMALQTDDEDGYERALAVSTEHDMLHGVVPLTATEAVKTLVKAHVDERSDENNLQWRIGWVVNPTLALQAVYDQQSGSDLLATVSEYSPGQYRKVTAAAALFVTKAVRPGDLLRINFGLGPDGTTTYDTYTVDRVVDENNLVLVTGPAATITVPVKIEVWRNLTTQEYAEALGAYPAKFGDRRIRVVYADGAEDQSAGGALPLEYVAAALAGQRSGMAPHAPMSNVQIGGFVLNPAYKFSRTQLNTIAAGGNWIVTKDFTEMIFTRHQVTSAIGSPAYAGDLLQQEDTFTTNTDQISRDYRDAVKSLIGRGNVSDDMLALLRVRFQSTTEAIRNRPYPVTLGPQIVEMEILKLAVDPVNRDTVDAELDISEPAPFNRARVRLKISAA